jgi:hypothetical protein
MVMPPQDINFFVGSLLIRLPVYFIQYFMTEGAQPAILPMFLWQDQPMVV